MDNDEAEIQAFGDIPPGLEVLGAMPERATQTIKAIGKEIILAVYAQETTTSFDSDSAVYAA